MMYDNGIRGMNGGAVDTLANTVVTGLQGTLTSTASPASWSAWTELHSGLPFAVAGLRLGMLVRGSAPGTRLLVEIGVGAAASERAIITLPGGNDSFMQNAAITNHWVPLRLPKGARISGRVLSSLSVVRDLVSLFLVPIPESPFLGRGFSAVEIIGLPSTTTASVSFTTISTTADTVARAGTTANRWRAFGLACGHVAFGDPPGFGWVLQTSGGDVLYGPDFVFHHDRATGYNPGVWPIPCDIPAGTALEVNTRAKSAGGEVAPLLYGFF